MDLDKRQETPRLVLVPNEGHETFASSNVPNPSCMVNGCRRNLQRTWNLFECDLKLYYQCIDVLISFSYHLWNHLFALHFKRSKERRLGDRPCRCLQGQLFLAQPPMLKTEAFPSFEKCLRFHRVQPSSSAFGPCLECALS